MRPSPLLSAAAAAALLAAVAGPATAATAPAPAKGVASSSVTLLGVAAGGHTVTAGTLELLSDMLGAQSVAKVLLTPLTADGTAYGQQSVTPASSPVTAPSVDSSALVPALAGVASVRTPVLEATAADPDGEPSTTAGAASLGALSVLGLPVSLNGSVDVGSAVGRTTGAVGEKTIVVEDVALPSLADILAALGLNVPALPVEVLTELLNELDLVTTTIADLEKQLADATAAIQAQIDQAQADVDKASADLAAKTDELAGKQSELAAAEQDLQTKTAALNSAKTALAAEQQKLDDANATLTSATATLTSLLGTTSISTYESLSPEAKALLDPTGAIAAAYQAYKAAQTAVTEATAAVTTATTAVANAQSAVDLAAAAVATLRAAVAALQAVVDELQALLDAALAVLQNILKDVQPLIDSLKAAILAVLDGTPLLSFDSLSVVTEATATSNQDGGQSARIVGGELSGLKVLGTDILGDVLNTGTVDVLEITTSQLEAINGLIGDLTGALSSVLSSVPQFPTLSVPAPEVGLLTKSTSTDVVDGFGVASTSVKGLSITLPSVSIPTALALPGAIDLPALDGVTQVAGLLTSAPIKIDLATLSSNARFAPAVAGTGTPSTGTPSTGTPSTGTPSTGTPSTGTPGTAAPQLPRTGASQALAALGLGLMVAAFAARRRTEVAGLAG